MILPSAASQPASAALDWFMPWRWQARMLVVFAPNGEDPRLETQRDLLAPMSAEATARDLVTIEVTGDHSSDSRVGGGSLRLAFHVAADRFAVILIGKDGTEKMRVAAPISAAALFATIDAMPMRQEEMHQEETRHDAPRTKP